MARPIVRGLVNETYAVHDLALDVLEDIGYHLALGDGADIVVDRRTPWRCEMEIRARHNLQLKGLLGGPDHQGLIILRYDIPQDEASLARSLGVAARDALEVFMHMDEPTMDEVAHLLQHRPVLTEAHGGTIHWFDSGMLNTTYYFDPEGKFAKLSRVPNGVRDPRPDVWGSPRELRRIVSPMGPADFELAGFAIGILRQRVLTLPRPSGAPSKPG